MSAKIIHVVTDMGNGGAYCSGCDQDLGSDPWKIPNICPKCKEGLVDTDVYPYSFGGSDF